MKSYSSEFHILKGERGSSVYSFLGFAIVAVCVIAVIFVFPWGQLSSGSKDASLLSGMGALKNKDYNNAVKYFDKAIQIDSNNPAAYLGRAKAYLQLGKIDKAFEDANKAVDKKGGAEAFGQRAVVLKIQKKPVEALKDLDQATQMDGAYAWAFAQKADIYSKQKDYDKALEEANKAVKAKDRFVEGYRLRAWILTRQGKCKDAAENFKKAQDLKSDDAMVVQDRAWFLLTCPDEKLQDSAEAMKLAKKAVELGGGKDGLAQETLAEAYFRQGEALKAVEHQKEAIKLASKICPDGSCVNEMQQRLQKYELAARQEVRTGYEILPLDSGL